MELYRGIDVPEIVIALLEEKERGNRDWVTPVAVPS